MFGLTMSPLKSLGVRQVTYWLIACTLTIQFKYTFAEHFNPQQFGVVT
jgi:hypothetical protein